MFRNQIRIFLLLFSSLLCFFFSYTHIAATYMYMIKVNKADEPLRATSMNVNNNFEKEAKINSIALHLDHTGGYICRCVSQGAESKRGEKTCNKRLARDIELRDPMWSFFTTKFDCAKRILGETQGTHVTRDGYFHCSFSV